MFGDDFNWDEEAPAEAPKKEAVPGDKKEEPEAPEAPEFDWTDDEEELEEPEETPGEEPAATEEPIADEEPDEEPKGEQEEEAAQEQSPTYKDIARRMAEAGILSEVPEDEEVDESDLLDFFDAEMDRREEEIVKQFVEGFDTPEEIGFLRYKKATGGSLTDYLALNPASSLPFADVSTESGAALYMTSLLKKEGYSDDEAADEIEFMKERDSLVKTASRRKKAIDKKGREEQDRKVALAEQQAQQVAQQRKETTNRLQQGISSLTEINGVKISRRDAKALASQVTRPTEKIGDTYHTPLIARIKELYKPENVGKLALLTDLVMGDFDLSKYTSADKAKVIRKAKEGLEHRKPSTPRRSSPTKQKSLADYF